MTTRKVVLGKGLKQNRLAGVAKWETRKWGQSEGLVSKGNVCSLRRGA